MMLQTLLETGVRASELVQLRVEDVSLIERVVTIRPGKGGKRREVPIRRDLSQLLRLHIGTRRVGPLFASRQEGSGPTAASIQPVWPACRVQQRPAFACPESTSREDSPLGKLLRIVAVFTVDSITEDSTRPAPSMVTTSAADLIARIGDGQQMLTPSENGQSPAYGRAMSMAVRIRV